MMHYSDLDVTTAGINFSIRPTFRFGSKRISSAASCFISNQTLDELAAARYCNSHLPEEIFRQLEKEITVVASRLELDGVREQPLIVRYVDFNIVDD